MRNIYIYGVDKDYRARKNDVDERYQLMNSGVRVGLRAEVAQSQLGLKIKCTVRFMGRVSGKLGTLSASVSTSRRRRMTDFL